MEAARLLQSAPTRSETGTDPGNAIETARVIYRRRRRRDLMFGPLFADPAWDMLLDLFIAKSERKRVSISSLCIAAAVPPTTALRWMKVLEERGLAVREDDREDARRTYVEISPDAYAAMADLLG